MDEQDYTLGFSDADGNNYHISWPTFSKLRSLGEIWKTHAPALGLERWVACAELSRSFALAGEADTCRE